MPTRAEILRRRAAVAQAIRAFFVARDFVEVDTPVAISAPAPEPHLEAPRVSVDAGGRAQVRYLQTSPELPMKRLLVELPRIFQIAPVFRDGDFSERHRPEFRLLEWYRRDAPWTALLDDCEGLLVATADAADATHLPLSRPFPRVTMDEAFREHAGFSILEALEPAALRARLRERAVHFADDDTWDELFHRGFLSLVEPRLVATPRPFFLTAYPAPLAALARLDPHDARASERFELYAGGLELANGFGELVDPVEQRRRFEHDRAVRSSLGRHDYPFDERFFAALARLPSAAGIALGLERLLMLLLSAGDIDEVAFIPWSQS